MCTNMTPILFPITYKCNLSCSYCTVRNSRKEPNIRECLQKIAKSNNDWVFVTGGEPLLLDNIIDVCLKLKIMGKKIGLTTNGTIFDKFDIIKNIDRIGVSIDGSKELTDRYRGKGTFDKAMFFLLQCVGKVETVIMATVKEKNEDIIKIAKDINVDYLQVTYL
ncbi:MAG: radical SAM protein [Nitrosarchaeum sp.]|nr:radical SAM protein [Nitrosarchaeum sp.]